VSPRDPAARMVISMELSWIGFSVEFKMMTV
jgi:hypothetical protein